MVLSYPHIDSLEQDCSISIANMLEILQSCTKLSTWRVGCSYLSLIANNNKFWDANVQTMQI